MFDELMAISARGNGSFSCEIWALIMDGDVFKRLCNIVSVHLTATSSSFATGIFLLTPPILSPLYEHPNQISSPLSVDVKLVLLPLTE